MDRPSDETSPDFSKSESYIREGVAFGEQLLEETDRGAALVGLAFIDEMLKRVFEAKMVKAKITPKLLKYPGALSTASARTDVAYSLGWIGARTYRDLVTVRKIRNVFAHAHAPLKFTDEAIANLCTKLSLGDGETVTVSSHVGPATAVYVGCCAAGTPT